jgi:hypothetical protein
LQDNFENLKLKKSVSKYRLIFIITIFLICTVNVFFVAIGSQLIVTTNINHVESSAPLKNTNNLELKADDTLPTSSGLKVETVAISCPVSFESGDNQLSNLNHLIELYSKKKYSLKFQSNLLISKTIHISPLITRLQI